MIITIVNSVCRIFEFVILLDCIFSWLPNLRGNEFVEAISSLAGIVLNPIRQVLFNFTNGFPLDISPIIAFVLIDIIRGLIITIL